MGTQIIDLLGNILRPRPNKFRFWVEVPLDIFKNLVYTRDRISGVYFLLCKDRKGKYYSIRYNIELDLYYSYRLDYMDYDESKDMRYEWKYRKHKKIS